MRKTVSFANASDVRLKRRNHLRSGDRDYLPLVIYLLRVLQELTLTRQNEQVLVKRSRIMSISIEMTCVSNGVVETRWQLSADRDVII